MEGNDESDGTRLFWLFCNLCADFRAEMWPCGRISFNSTPTRRQPRILATNWYLSQVPTARHRLAESDLKPRVIFPPLPAPKSKMAPLSQGYLNSARENVSLSPAPKGRRKAKCITRGRARQRRTASARSAAPRSIIWLIIVHLEDCAFNLGDLGESTVPRRGWKAE